VSLDSIKRSLLLYGQLKPIVVRKAGMVVIAGNGTLEAARALGWTQIAANVIDVSEIEAVGYGLADNRTAELSYFNMKIVARLDKLLQEAGHENVGWTLEELAQLRAGGDEEKPATPTLSDRFIVPPFSVLDAR
jgi:ParB-like chromosome segregation protein Spo0J